MYIIFVYYDTLGNYQMQIGEYIFAPIGLQHLEAMHVEWMLVHLHLVWCIHPSTALLEVHQSWPLCRHFSKVANRIDRMSIVHTLVCLSLRNWSHPMFPFKLRWEFTNLKSSLNFYAPRVGKRVRSYIHTNVMYD